MPVEPSFVLQITPSGGTCQVEARCPFLSGSASATIKTPSAAEWQKRLQLLQDALLWRPDTIKARTSLPDLTVNSNRLRAAQRRRASDVSASEQIIKETGQDLFEAFFSKSIWTAYTESFEKARNQMSTLHLRLSFTGPGLSYLPWETLHDGVRHLALSTQSPIVRNAHLDSNIDLPVASPPITVLGMVPKIKNTSEFDEIDTVSERNNIRSALASLIDQHKLILQWSGGTPMDLIHSLRNPPHEQPTWHIFHYSGHGGFDQSAQRGFIVVDADPGPVGVSTLKSGSLTLYSDVLSGILDTTRGLRLVILNSCGGASGSSSASSAAQELVNQGFPAVIAMQFPITDQAAIYFSAILYKYLADNTPLHHAVTHARQQMKANSMAEWITPVLYMQSANGQLFRT